MPSVRLLRPVAVAESSSLVVDLQSALDLESFWQACLRLIESQLPHRSCSLMFNIVDYEPTEAKHHVVSPRNPDYVPATSLTISGPYLERHPQVKLYTYSQILSEDPDARRRRLDQDPDTEWNEFVHLAFWRGNRPDAVLSIRRPLDQSAITAKERAFLEQLHPMVEASLRRLRAVETERSRRLVYESFLQRIPMAVMFVNTDGERLFATPEGQKQCARWNRGLRNSSESEVRLRMPNQAGLLVNELDPSSDLSSAKPVSRSGALKLRHPSLPGLALTIDRTWQVPGQQLKSCYVVTFLDECSDEVNLREPTQKAMLALQQLSPGERRVALLVSKGMRNGEIARHMCRSRRTIESQLNSIYRKLELTCRTQLASLLS